MVRPAARNSCRTKSIRSDTLVILGYSSTRAPFPARAARSALPLAPPAWVTTRRTSGGGSAASRVSSSATSLPALCASRITTTQPPPNREGAVSVARSPWPSAPPLTSWTPLRAGNGPSPAPAGPVAAVAAATSRATARSTSSSSSPTTTATAGLAVVVPPEAAWEAMPEACHDGGAA